MTTQLQRLARPFPAKYVKKPPQGKYGSYVPHDVVQQAMLAILGPVNILIGQVFYGENERIEGCLVTLVAEVDGRRVEVTEVGDCENPGNWKTQGARMKDAISDGVKRCAMRLGLGLHLWAQEDYFLYRHLTKNAEEGSRDPAVFQAAPSAASGPLESAPPAPEEPSGSPTPSDEDAASESSGTPGPISKNRRQRVKARAMAIGNWNLVNERSREWNLPSIERSTDEELGLYDEMLATLEPPMAEAKS